jgi:predicted transposase YdaD
MATRPNPHDAFFRQAFGSPKHVVGLLRLVLPKHLQAVLDLDPEKIRILDPTHVDAELRSTGSDLVVEVPRRAAAGDSDRAPAIFILAIEHQRQDERFIVVRQLGYTVRIWERWLREHPDATHLPPVIPVVIHNGERPWRSPTSLHALLDLPDVPLDPSLRALLPSMEVVLADLASPDLTRAVLRSRADDADMVSETQLEILQGATRADADALLDDWASRLRPLHDEPAGWSTLVAALCYLAQVSAIPKPHLAAAADALPEPTKETFMTAAQEWFLEGKQEGRTEGREEGKVEGREEGERSALASVLTRQVRLRFRDIPPEAIARIEAAHKPELESWLERILTAETLEDLFA